MQLIIPCLKFSLLEGSLWRSISGEICPAVCLMRLCRLISQTVSATLSLCCSVSLRIPRPGLLSCKVHGLLVRLHSFVPNWSLEMFVVRPKHRTSQQLESVLHNVGLSSLRTLITFWVWSSTWEGRPLTVSEDVCVCMQCTRGFLKSQDNPF